ncbi:MAG TPA: sugar ABC transporter permease [Streptosporangiaceae bacterium]|nr:sugar ABC transporter permease [Streptosporangiaceae bacterium]
MSETALRQPTAAVAQPRVWRGPGRRSVYARRRGRSGLAFVTPFMILFTLFMIVPLVYAVYESLYTTKLIGGTRFSGFANYSTVLQSGPFWGGVIRVVIFGGIQIPVMLAIAFFFATIFDLGVAKWGRFFRAVYFVPFAVPIVVSALMWGFLFDPAYGPFNRLMNSIGFHNFNWLSSGLMVPSIIIIAIWEWTGYTTVIMYTALKSVPRDLVEAAILDDTPLWRIILRIKLPMVRPAIILLIFINTIGAMQLFVEPNILNNYQAGVITNTWTPVINIYSTAISNGEYQLGAAMAVVLAIIIIAISVASLAFRNRRRSFS